MKKAYRIRLAAAFIIFLAIIAGFFGMYPAKLADMQFAPILQKVFVDFSVAALVLAIAAAAVTAIFGRFYCSTVCPFGFLQEVAALFFGRKKKSSKNFPVKYFISAVTFGVLVGGSAIALRYIEPYTLFGSAITVSAVGIVATLTVLAIVFSKTDFFARTFAPSAHF